MFNKIRFIILMVLLPSCLLAQQDTANTNAQRMSSGIRISLLTCGTGDQVYETFGHTAIRVTDSMLGTDNVYNYGTFNGYSENFELQFMRGKLLYYVSYYPYSNFLKEYAYYGRSVEEQVLHLGDNDKEEIYAALRYNAKEENKYYKYDFYFDNCATRIRDIFKKALGDGFMFGYALPEGQELTFRDITNQYFYRKHWERVGVNLLLGSRIDKVMTNEDIMFLPDFLRDAMAGARNNVELFASDSKVVLDGSPHKPAGINQPLILMLGIALLTLLGLSVNSLSFLGKVMTFLVLFISGLLGVIMLLMWLGTDHQACQNNFNVLWALPTNLLLAFTSKKGKGKYATLAMVMLFISLILHMLSIQKMLLLEFGPLLLSLVFIYGAIIRKNKVVKS